MSIITTRQGILEICQKYVDLVLVMPFHDKVDNWITRPVTKILLQVWVSGEKVAQSLFDILQKVCVTHPVVFCYGRNESG